MAKKPKMYSAREMSYKPAQKKPQSVQKSKKNKIVEKFVKNQGFGYDYYMNDNLKDTSQINAEVDKLVDYYMEKLNQNLEPEENEEEEYKFEEEYDDFKQNKEGSIKNISLSEIKQTSEKEKSGLDNQLTENYDDFDEISKNDYSPVKDPTTVIEHTTEDKLESIIRNTVETENNQEFSNLTEKLEQSIQSIQSNQEVKQTSHSRPESGKTRKSDKTETKPVQPSQFNSKTDRPKRPASPEDEYSHINVAKSAEVKPTENYSEFDMEFMCRCLALAVMKHIENSQNKFHIIELLDLEQKYDFCSSIYNENLDFFETFFNIQRNMEIAKSNLERLESKKEEKASCQVDTGVSFFGHLKREVSSEELEQKNQEILLKHQKFKEPGSKDDKEVQMVNQFFTQPQGDKHKNVSARSKEVLLNNLNKIEEMDSIDYCQKNNLLTDKTNKTKKPSETKFEPMDLLRQSVEEFLGGDEPEEQSFKEEGKNKRVDSDLEANLEEQNSAEEEENEFDEQAEAFKSKVLEDSVQEEINEPSQSEELFESGQLESNYIINVEEAENLKEFLKSQVSVFDDDFVFEQNKVVNQRPTTNPDVSQIFEFVFSVVGMSRMEKEVVILCLVYLERFIFNTGVLVNGRNWKRLLFVCLMEASKVWDDDSYENNHFSQVFTHLSVEEINLLERVFLEMINYKIHVKFSEYFKYFFIVKSIALKYSYDGNKLVPISVKRMVQLQEAARQQQEKVKRQFQLSSSWCQS